MTNLYAPDPLCRECAKFSGGCSVHVPAFQVYPISTVTPVGTLIHTGSPFRYAFPVTSPGIGSIPDPGRWR